MQFEKIIHIKNPIKFEKIPMVTIHNGAIAGASVDTSTSVVVDTTRTNNNEIVFNLTPTNNAVITENTCYFCMVNFSYD